MTFDLPIPDTAIKAAGKAYVLAIDERRPSDAYTDAVAASVPLLAEAWARDPEVARRVNEALEDNLHVDWFSEPTDADAMEIMVAGLGLGGGNNVSA